MDILEFMIGLGIIVVSLFVLYIIYITDIIFESPLFAFVIISAFVEYVNRLDFLEILAYLCFVFVSAVVVCLFCFVNFKYDRFKQIYKDRNENKLSRDDKDTFKLVFISSLYIVHTVILYVNLILYLNLGFYSPVLLFFIVLCLGFCFFFMQINIVLVNGDTGTSNTCPLETSDDKKYWLTFMTIVITTIGLVLGDRNTKRTTNSVNTTSAVPFME